MKTKNHVNHSLLKATMLSPLAVATMVASGFIQADTTLEEVVVTGSNIKRVSQANTSTPLASFDQNSLQDNGVKDLRDLIELLPINSGAQNNSDNLTQNFTAGTSNINLRGLGVSSTLVLLNGKRQVLSSVNTDEGSSFVDTASLVPVLAVKRVEILKDGASAIYGSDAVAGVANFITRDDMEGTEFQIEHRTRTGNGSQDDTNFDAAVGGSFGETGHFLLAASYLDRSSLVLGEVDWLQPATSGFGNPGSFVVPSLGRTVADPGCATVGGIPQALANGSTLCRFDFGPQVTAVPEEERMQGFARATWDWSDTTQMWSEIGYARNKISREVSPSFPVLNAPTVPAYHPNNIFGEDVAFLGRPFGNGAPTEINFYDHNTFRFAVGANGQFSDKLSWDLSFVSAQNDAVLNPRDVITDNFQAALNGLGGTGCVGNTPGANGCQFFNPFSSSFSTAPNDPGLKSFIIGDYLGDAESKMDVIEAVISGNDLFEMGGGSVGFAIGAQYRDESLSYVYDSITQQDGFAFLFGNPNFSGSRNVTALYGELLLPFSENLEVSAAVRYEDYGGGVGDTTDPKLSVLWRPTDTFSLRGSVSTSFRAPSVFQTKGIQTNFANITDADGSTTFAANRTVGSDTLTPETSTALNIGFSWQPTENWDIDIDYWNFSFEDVLTKNSAQGIVTANPNDPRIIRTSAGTVAVVNTAFVNANAIDTDGIDLSARGVYDTSIGILSPSLDFTYVLSYDLENDSGVSVDGLGFRNGGNFGNPTPELRANLGLNWSNDRHSANIYFRHVSSYDNDTNNNEEIDSFNTIDAQYSIGLGDFLKEGSETSLTVGIVNATDEDPPFVRIAGSYDPRTGDPRGRRVYVKLGTKF